MFPIGAGRFECLLAFYGFHRHSNCLRRYILVVERSPRFLYRRFAADCPLFHCLVFQTVTFTVSSSVVVQDTLGDLSNSPSYRSNLLPDYTPVHNITLEVVILLEGFAVLELTLLVMLELRCCSS